MDIGVVLGEIILFKKLVLSPTPLMINNVTNSQKDKMIRDANKRAERKQKKLSYRLSKQDWDVDTCNEYFEKQ